MIQPPIPHLPPRSDQLVYDDGEPMESARHRDQMNLLIDSLKEAWQDRDDFYVGGNMFLYFSELQAKKNDFRGPDVFVVMNTTRRERRAWVVWEEDGQVPDVIIELLSDKTEKVDRGVKMDVYARLRVSEYFLFDPFTGVLEGYDLDVLQMCYEKKRPDEQGHLRCKRLGLWLAPVLSSPWEIEERWLRWVGDDGRVLPAPSEVARAQAERANSEAARANAEAARANSEAERANAEAERANAETERADRLAAELAALKARGPGGSTTG